MNDPGTVLRCRERLEAAKLMYEHMTLYFQDEKKFRHFLDAFLALARSVPHILKPEFHDNKSLVRWYEQRAKEFYSSKIVKLLVEMRNISLKEHTPMMATTAALSVSLSVIIGENPDTKEISTEGKTENVETPSLEADAEAKKRQPAWTSPKIVRYCFDELPTWFDENPDVMYLCCKYLDELENFVSDAENLSKEKKEGVKP
jgi:hypothetical protein